MDIPVDPSRLETIGPVGELVAQTADGIVHRNEIEPDLAELIARAGKFRNDGQTIYLSDTANVTLSARSRVQKVDLMAWLRASLTDQAKLQALARDVGIPELSGLWALVPKTPVKLQDLLDTYKQHADVTPLSKRNTCATFTEFMKMTGATTLDDLTTETLSAYRDAIKSRLTSPGSIGGYFGRVKWVIKHGQAFGHDAKQIREALDRMAVLKAPKDRRVHTPTPISRADWDKLYQAATGKWRALLLTMLNCCLHLGEALDVEWSDFDLDAGTFCTRRNKTGRVIRAATLWPETMAALKAIERTGSQFVFVSRHGTRFHAGGQWTVWNHLRKVAGVNGVQLDDIRDGAYSAACNAVGVEEKCARLLAGHRSHGWQDSYVERNPSVVAPACDAVYRAYMQPLAVKAAA